MTDWGEKTNLTQVNRESRQIQTENTELDKHGKLRGIKNGTDQTQRNNDQLLSEN